MQMAGKSGEAAPLGRARRQKERRERVMLRNLADAFRELRRAYGESAGSYRPDLHYMRGPGPKWHAKYGSLPPKPTSNGASVAQSLHDAAEQHA
jgi:hypothetical protein